MGGQYSERTLGEVLGEGGGSSFDGFVRPSYATILRKFDYYLTGDFRRRFLKQPGSYLSRLFSPSIDGRQLQVDRRWEHVVGQEDAQALFADAEVRALSRENLRFLRRCVRAAGCGAAASRRSRPPVALGRHTGCIRSSAAAASTGTTIDDGALQLLGEAGASRAVPHANKRVHRPLPRAGRGRS